LFFVLSIAALQNAICAILIINRLNPFVKQNNTFILNNTTQRTCFMEGMPLCLLFVNFPNFTSLKCTIGFVQISRTFVLTLKSGKKLFTAHLGVGIG